jgi:hypothetical protein
MEEPNEGEDGSGAMILEHGSVGVARFLDGTTRDPARAHGTLDE